MTIRGAMEDASFAGNVVRCGAAREAIVVVVLMYGLTRGAEAMAGDSTSNALTEIQPIIGGTPLSMAFLPSKSVTIEPQFSTTEFGARGPSKTSAALAAAPESLGESQPLHSTTAWQRLADYRSQGRVQLLTLWQSSRSTVSLQAGKHGGPSLQWSSRSMNRGGATRGLLDRFVASSLGATGLASKLAARSSNAAAANKMINLIPAAKIP